MGGKLDEVKGRVEEAVGAITDNNELREQGQTDQAAGKLKQKVQNAIETVGASAQRAIDRVKDAAK